MMQNVPGSKTTEGVLAALRYRCVCFKGVLGRVCALGNPGKISGYIPYPRTGWIGDGLK